MIQRLLLLAAIVSSLGVHQLAAQPPHIVFMIGEEEYHTWETLPDFAEKDLTPRGYRVSIVNADATDKNHFPGLIAALKDADLLFLSVRRRTPPKEQLDAVRAYLAAGKPFVGIRTASHAFALRPKDTLKDPSLAAWQQFDPEVIGGNYSGHHGKDKVAVSLAPGAQSSAILQGVAVGKLVGGGGLYKVSPLAAASIPLLIGTIQGQPPEPVAWTHVQGAKQGRVFYTSLGHPDDFQIPEFRTLLVNAVAWALGR